MVAVLVGLDVDNDACRLELQEVRRTSSARIKVRLARVEEDLTQSASSAVAYAKRDELFSAKSVVALDDEWHA